MKIRCPAKINLMLEILGRRPDGFHEIRTLFQTIDFSDTLELRDRGGTGLGLTIQAPGMDIPSGAKNLVHQAYTAFHGAFGTAPGLDATLVKRIPPGSGLGGASSDAASMLLALQSISGRPDFNRLARLAGDLGSDVPFFLHRGTAAGRGRGERIASLPDAHKQLVLLILPTISMATSEVYGAWKPILTTGTNRISIHRYLNGKAGVCPRREIQRNDLESVVFRIAPRLATLKDLLYSTGAGFASLSGSGSALFGLYDSEASVTAAASRFQGRSCSTVVTRFLGRQAGGQE